MLQSHLQKLTLLRPKLQALAEQNTLPLYVFDKEEAIKNLHQFKQAFNDVGEEAHVFFAIKSNPYIGLLKTVVEAGEGLDASSPRELTLALEAGAQKIIYTGPAKTAADFELILKNAEKITVNLESVRELETLDHLAKEQGKVVRCGLRVTTQSQSGWTKFGLPLKELRGFYDRAKTHKNINFCGIHFHISMNKDATRYLQTLREIAQYFQENFSEGERAEFEYLDMGGGFYPNVFEGIYGWNPDQEMKFFSGEDHFKKILADEVQPRTIPINVSPINEFAEQIAEVLQNELKPLCPVIQLYCEPGRFLCHSVMHLLMTLIDIKGPHMGIVDAGGNMIGWEKYQFFNYVPLLNLTRWNLEREVPFIVYGSLCTPDDIWGYYLTGDPPEEGDFLVMPFQGAYTYTLAQNFIKDIPKVVELGM